MKAIGITTEGKIVYKGVGKLYFQEGLPLGIIFDQMDNSGMMPSWIHLYMEMKENGMLDERIFHLLNEHMVDTYGKKFRDEVIKRLRSYSSIGLELPPSKRKVGEFESP